jgi:hypothetical protein
MGISGTKSSAGRGLGPSHAVRRALCAFALSALAVLLTASSALAAPEKPKTQAATGVTSSSATLNGVLNPAAEALAGYEFTYNSNGTCTEGPTTALAAEQLTEALAVSAPLTSLEPSRTYTFCLIATHLAGEALESTSGAEVSFKTLAAKPAVDSESATAVTSTGATLEAQINPENQEASYVFEYSTQKKAGVLEGTITKVPGGEPIPASLGDQPASVQLSGLAPGTTYYYRVVAKDATGSTADTVTSFVTPPTPVTEAPTAVTATTATLNGRLTLGPGPVSVNFDYNLGGSCAGGLATPPEPETIAPQVAVTGLEPNALYSVCLLASTLTGSETGAPVALETLAAPPTIESESASAVKETTATLEAQVNPNNQEAPYTFEYSTQGTVGAPGTLEGTIAKAPGSEPLASGFGAASATVAVTGLAPGRPYYFRVAATNPKAEAASGEVQSFTTLAMPLVTTAPAGEVTRTTAALSGTVNPGGVATTYHFVYVPAAHYLAGSGECAEGVPCSYGEGAVTTAESEPVGSDYTVHVAGPTEVSELKPGTAYDYALVATSAQGTTVGPNQEFTTSPATVPIAITGAASEVGQLSATLTGSVDTRGLLTTVQFELVGPGTTAGHESLTAASTGTPTGTVVPVSLTFPGDLQPGTTYYYRVLATSSDGTGEGALASFTTLSSPVPAAFAPAASPPFVPFASIAELEAREAPAHPTSSQPLTNAQKLAAALKACHKLKKKHKRASCERQARSKYAAKKARN